MRYPLVLFVDDDEDDHHIFYTAMTQLFGHGHYNGVTSAFEALEQLTSGKLKPDLIFLDLNMPIMDGQTFLSEIKRDDMLRNIPVVILSTASNPRTIEATMALGAIKFVTKPDTLTGLKATLQSILC